MTAPEKAALTLLLLATLIFVHELGHFLIAKLFKVKVLKFSLGFGPKLVGFRWGETEYLISVLPLGGYVKMAGEEPNDEVAPEDKGRGFHEKAPWQRACISLAGPVMNLTFPVLVYFVAFYSQSTDISSRLGRVVPDQPAYRAGLRAGDRITAVDGEPVKYFSDLQRLISPKWEKPVAVTFDRGGKTLSVNVVPEKVEDRNILETETRGIIGVGPMAYAPVIGVADPASPAGRAGLRTFDRVVKVGDKAITTYPDLVFALEEKAGPVKLTVIRDAPEHGAAGPLTLYQTLELTLTPDVVDGKPVFGLEHNDLFVFSVDRDSPAWEAGLRRGDRLVSVDGQELHGWASFDRVRMEAKEKPFTLAFIHEGHRQEKVIGQKQTVQYDEFENKIPILLFGGNRDNRFTSFVEAEQVPFSLGVGQSLARALKVVPDEIRKTALVLVRLVTGDISFKSVGGPIMMYDLASRAAEAGLNAFLSIMALISINLGIMNLLPVPVLDGFHILSAGVEAIRGRPMSLRARIVANYIGLAMLFTLMFFVFRNDIIRFILN